jgi:hypothetical protein
MKKKGYSKGGKAGGKLEMVKDPATGKMVPAYAMDGEGSGDMAKGKNAKDMKKSKGMEPEMKPKKKKKRSDAMDAVMGTGPAAPRKRMNMGGMAMKKKGYAKGGKVRGAGIASKGVRPCKMR